MGYYQDQIDDVLEEPEPGWYKIKITSVTKATKWMNITPKELSQIRAILKRA